MKAEGVYGGCAGISMHPERDRPTGCQFVYDEFIAARERYASEVDPAGAAVTMGGANWFGGKIDRLDSRGVPVLDWGAQAYFWAPFRMISWANEYAIDCEVYHYIHFVLHGADERSADATGEKNANYVYEVIGHNTSDDPMHFACNEWAVRRYLAVQD
jgi:hypothetical protein